MRKEQCIANHRRSVALDEALYYAETLQRYMRKRRDFCQSGRDRGRDVFIFDAHFSDLADHLSGALKRLEETR